MGCRHLDDIMAVIGIRRESKNRWERRTPLTPQHVGRLGKDHGIEFLVQPSDLRIFPDDDYREVGAEITEDLSPCDIILGVKEVPNHEILQGKTYMFFSHTIKGQAQNMEMLSKLMENGTTLIDYEKITDEQGRRLVFFGWHAGVAGMIDALWTLGRRLEWEGIRNPFSSIMPAHEYHSLPEAREQIASVGRSIATYGVPYALRPLVFGIAGYGNVAKGAQEILDLLPTVEVSPEELPNLSRRSDTGHHIYKVVFKENHMVEREDPSKPFDLQDYYQHPEGYRPTFIRHVPYLTVLMNCIYWDSRYPRLITKEQMKTLYSDMKPPLLRVIGDISCDPEGAIEATLSTTTPASPVYVYDPWEDSISFGWKGTGPVILAVDNLPCEISLESSQHFGESLREFLPFLANADLKGPLEDLKVPGPLMAGMILFKGKLTEQFAYMKEYIGDR